MRYRTAIVGARLLDPASRLDAPGGVLIEDGRIVDLGPAIGRDALPEDAIRTKGSGRAG